MADNVDTSVLEFAGRRIAFRKPTPGQLVMLMRLVRRAQSSLTAESDDVEVSRVWVNVTVKMLDAIDSLIVEDGDREFLEAKMLAGDIGIDDLRPVLGGDVAAEADDDDAAAPTPRKTAKRTVGKPAKKAAPKKRRA